jgi:hypothetical protein
VRIVPVARKLSTMQKGARNNIICFGREITLAKVTNQKLSWDNVPVNMLDLGIINFPMIFNDTYRVIRNEDRYEM